MRVYGANIQHTSPFFDALAQSRAAYDAHQQAQAAVQAQQIRNQFAPQNIQSSLQSQLLQNQMNQARMKTLPDLLQAQLHKAQQAPVASTQIVQTPQGYAQINNQTGQATMLTDPTGKPLMPIKKGMAITSQPGGGFQITTGGLTPTQLVAPADHLTQETDDQGNTTLVPSSNSSRSYAGGTLVNTTTGDAVSIPTQQTTSTLQQSISSNRLLQPELTKLSDDITPLIGMKNAPTRLLKRGEKIIGMDTPKLNAYDSAIRTQIPQHTDQLIKAFGLNPSDKTFNQMKNTISPRIDDTSHSYHKRIADSLSSMIMRDKSYSKFLKQDIPLQTTKDKVSLEEALSDQMYNMLEHKVPPSQISPSSQQAQDTQRGTVSVNYRGETIRNLTPEKAKALISKYGGSIINE